ADRLLQREVSGAVRGRAALRAVAARPDEEPLVAAHPGEVSARNNGRSLNAITIHVAANASVDTSTAAPAPVTPHSAPNSRISGTSPAPPTAGATTRRPARPIVTGNDFAQPNTSWIAAATSTNRAAPTAGAYSSVSSSRTSHGISSSA